MKVRFLGHAAVLLTSQDGTTLLVDPYNPGGFGGKMAYQPISHLADAVVCSHDHVDHCAISDLPNEPHLIEGDAGFGPFSIGRHQAFHDEYDGRRRGGTVDVLDIAVDGMRLVHLSDVGHAPTAALVDKLRAPDLLFVPVGGFYTIGAAQAFEWVRRLAPRRVVPLHYKTARCELPIRPRSTFEAYFPSSRTSASRRPVSQRFAGQESARTRPVDQKRAGATQQGGAEETSCVELKSRMISFDHSVILLGPEG